MTINKAISGISQQRISSIQPYKNYNSSQQNKEMTTSVTDTGDNLARAGDHVLFFSLEQSRFEIATKGISRITAQMDITSAVSAIDIREGQITEAVKKAVECYSSFAQNEIIVECGFDTTVETIKNIIESYIAQTGVRPVVIVDYIQIIRQMDIRQTAKDTVDTHIRALKKMQSDNDLVVIAISMLSMTTLSLLRAMRPKRPKGFKSGREN